MVFRYRYTRNRLNMIYYLNSGQDEVGTLVKVWDARWIVLGLGWILLAFVDNIWHRGIHGKFE